MEKLLQVKKELVSDRWLIDEVLFQNIQPYELVGQGWMKKDKLERAPNVMRMIDRFNEVRAVRVCVLCVFYVCVCGVCVGCRV